MIEKQTNSGPVLLFTTQECERYAYAASCMPTDSMGHKERNFVWRIDAKFRQGRGGHLTLDQWKWFSELMTKYTHLNPENL